MVKQYSMPWEEKGAVLKKLKGDYESKRQQLSIAVKHLEMVASEVGKACMMVTLCFSF